MTTQEFVSTLKENGDLGLNFHLSDDRIIPETYHITEIKNAIISSVDCGGNSDAYNHTVVQLHVNPLEKLRRPWSAGKALSIFEKVDEISKIDPEAEIFFEYGDDFISTSQFSIQAIKNIENQLYVKLWVKPTVCKPSLAAKTEMSCC